MSALPSPRTPDPRSAPPLNWGVLGTGWIAERFTGAVRRHTRQRFTAVASRDAARSAKFAARHGVPRAYGSYEELVADDEVDVVHVATEHTAHLACARLALEAGKHVLVEKPLGLNAAQATEIAELAAERGLFCAEALWTFFLPRFDVVRQVLDSGVLGPAESVQASGQAHPAGVNGQIGAVLSTGRGEQAVVHTTLFSDTPTTAVIAGTEGTLQLPGPFHHPGDVVFTPAGGRTPLTYT